MTIVLIHAMSLMDDGFLNEYSSYTHTKGNYVFIVSLHPIINELSPAMLKNLAIWLLHYIRPLEMRHSQILGLPLTLNLSNGSLFEECMSLGPLPTCKDQCCVCMSFLYILEFGYIQNFKKFIH